MFVSYLLIRQLLKLRLIAAVGLAVIGWQSWVHLGPFVGVGQPDCATAETSSPAAADLGPQNLLGSHSEAVRDPNPPSILGAYPWPMRAVGWLAAALFLPLLCAPLIAVGLERESNGANLIILLVLSLFAGGLAFVLLGGQIDTALSAGLVVAGFAVSLAYNWFVLNKLEEIRI